MIPLNRPIAFSTKGLVLGYVYTYKCPNEWERTRRSNMARRIKHNKRQGRKRYSEAFKLSIVEEISSGKCSQAEIIRRHGISSSGTISNWLKKYGKTGADNIKKLRGANAKMSKSKELNERGHELTEENQRLKRELRESQVKNLLNETMLEIIEEDYSKEFGLENLKKKLNIERLSDYKPELLKMCK